MANYYPTNYSITLYDLYEEDPTILDILDSDQYFKSLGLKNKFLSYWGIYEIGAETKALFKKFIEQVYNANYVKYNKAGQLWDDDYRYTLEVTDSETYSETNTDSATNSNTSKYGGTGVNYDLPNKTTSNEYPTEKNTQDSQQSTEEYKNNAHKEDYTRSWTKHYDPVEQRNKYLASVNDIMYLFIKEFKYCFCGLM